MKFSYEVLKDLGTLSESSGLSKKVKLIRWNNGPAVIDIRTWDNETDRAYKGVTVKDYEVPALIEILTKYLKGKETKQK